MNRNTQAHFANIPGVEIGRSKFDRSFTHKTSWKNGQLIPVFCDMDIVPGDTVSMKQAEVVRLVTPVTPVMDNAVMDFYWFFIPNRLVYEKFKEFMGENSTAPWTSNYDGQIPQLRMQSGLKNSTTNNLTANVRDKSVLDYLGIPPQTDWAYATSGSASYKEIEVSALPARAYCLIWNEFFRDENLQNPVEIDLGSTTQNIVNVLDADYLDDPDACTVEYEQLGGLPPLNVCKTHDYFTSCLPGAQKGPAVTIPLSNNPDDSFVKIKNYNGDTSDMDGQRAWFKATYHSGTNPYNVAQLGTTDVVTGTNSIPGETFDTNLYVDLERATGATVTQLRQAFAIQKFYERDARGGTRYIESVWSHFGVRNPDFRVQRPEYLGGWRQRININQVIATNESDNATLGETGAYSVTSHTDGNVFTHSFTEHGILMGVMCCRQESHTYAQGINRAWFKKDRLDFYSPEFANLSEMAVKNREIYAQGTSDDNAVFGYQEAWAEMRYFPDRCSAEMRPDGTQQLGDVWTWADWYETKPRLGDKWIKEGPENIDRTLALSNQQQFWGDFYFGATYTRPMPLYSIPGLIDHH